MPDPFATTEIDAALDQIQAAMGVAITYHRSGISPVQLTAVVGQTEVDSEGGDSFAAGMRTRDYLIEAADLVDGATPIEPRAGDYITEDAIGAGTRFVVTKRPGGEAWRYSTPHRSELRVHTIERLVAS